jgi:2,5-diamino-6-(ribosylamino)-4(3H)-pyrimidinone 5'-phosphate reductase
MTTPRKHRNRSHLPFVFVNVAITADGKINTANRKVGSFSSSRDSEHMLELRMKADAVIAGARTVDLHPITMGTGGAKYRRERIRHGLAEYNLRVIVSGSGTVDLNAAIFKKRFSPIIILTTKRAGPKRLAAMRRRAQDVILCGKSEINFEYALDQLRNKWNVKRLLCEGGGELNDALFRAGLVNELHLTICPKIFGGDAAPTLADGGGHLKLADATNLELKSSQRIGDELFLVYRVRKS